MYETAGLIVKNKYGYKHNQAFTVVLSVGPGSKKKKRSNMTTQ